MALKSKSDVRAGVPVEQVTATAGGGDLVRVNLVVTKAVRTKWRAEALHRDIPLAELIRQAMKQYTGL